MSHVSESNATPLMRQYFHIKSSYPGTLLLFQVGDFYELFFDDAKAAAACLGIALTKRGMHNNEPIPLCGVPVHALDYYLIKLIKAGHKVALCQQLEEAKPGKVVDRGVTQVLTPGTLTDTKLLNEKSASYLFALMPGPECWALVFGELLTAQLYATIIPAHAEKALEAELCRFFPDEIIIPAQAESDAVAQLCKKMGYFVSRVADDQSDRIEHAQWLQQFAQSVQQHIQNHATLGHALYYLYRYLRITQRGSVDQFKTLHIYQSNDFLILDRATQDNLELITSSYDHSRQHTLFQVLDGAVTPMGSRMIKKWIMRPLIKQSVIEQRFDVVQSFITHLNMHHGIQKILKEIGDIERVVGRIALARAPLHDYRMLCQVLASIPQIKHLITLSQIPSLLQTLVAALGEFESLHRLLVAALNEDPSKEWIIKEGFDQRLDEMRSLVDHAQEKIMALEQKEQQETGIASLKIRYNGIQGYYIEITKTHSDGAPARYVRVQTLSGKERFMTPALQQLQHEILQARADIAHAEQAVFDHVKREVYNHVPALRKMAHALAHLDALAGFAAVACDRGYARPAFNQERTITIIQGRHPVVEQVMEHAFIPNDVHLDNTQSTWVITGPNMGGKSTFLRQVALHCIMAQVGSFVPAQSACVPLLDRVFTRIGAGDQLAQGKSTFLVEMEETATICNQATEHSLVILDEIGRGTSTFDGLAIAHAVLEYLHTRVKARCLFATHYHELALLPEKMPGIVSYHAACRRTEHGILFLYKMIAGAADGSFGIDVAKLARIPSPIIDRAQQLLQILTTEEEGMLQGAYQAGPIISHAAHENTQALQHRIDQLLQELEKKDRLITQLKGVDVDLISPRQALDLLGKLQEQL